MRYGLGALLLFALSILAGEQHDPLLALVQGVFVEAETQGLLVRGAQVGGKAAPRQRRPA
jgi:hypothetical protein